MEPEQSSAEGSVGSLLTWNRKVIVGILVVLVALGYLAVTSFQSSAVYYLTVPELKAKGAAAYAEKVRLGGRVAPGSILRESQSATVRFTMAQGDEALPVVYRGIVPDIFGDGIDVVVEGSLRPGGHFEAKTLLAKCPSKFEALQDSSPNPGPRPR